MAAFCSFWYANGSRNGSGAELESKTVTVCLRQSIDKSHVHCRNVLPRWSCGELVANLSVDPVDSPDEALAWNGIFSFVSGFVDMMRRNEACRDELVRGVSSAGAA